MYGNGGGHDGGNRHGDEGAGAKFEEQKFDGHQDSRQGRDKRGGHAGGGSRSQQHAPLVGREAGQLRENRAEGRSGLNDGTFRAKRSAGTNGKRRGQGFENAHAHAHLALADQHGLHGFRNAVALQRGLPKVNHDAHQQPANGRDQDHPRAQMVMDGEGHGERPLPIKEDIGEKVDQFQQALRHQATDESHEKRVRGGGENFGVKSLAEFPEPTGSWGDWRYSIGGG